MGLVIAGGRKGGYGQWTYMDNVERSSDHGVTFQELPNLPNKIISPCVVIVDPERIFTAGGYTVHPQPAVLNNAYMFNLTESEKGWIELLPMSFPRYVHTCGKVGPDHVAKKIVVVGGCKDQAMGWSNGMCQTRLKSVEIYTVASGSWENGKHGL